MYLNISQTLFWSIVTGHRYKLALQSKDARNGGSLQTSPLFHSEGQTSFEDGSLQAPFERGLRVLF